MKITFWGAARQVTGSMHLLELPSGTRVLIDCGLDYEKRKEFEERKKMLDQRKKEIEEKRKSVLNRVCVHYKDNV